MQLESSIFVARPPEEVWAYLGDVSNVAQWDRGVASTSARPNSPSGVGFEFDTLALRQGKPAAGDWGRMSYRIADIDPVRGCTVELTSRTGNARYFQSAAWRFLVLPEPGGSRIFCTAQFKLKIRYCLLAPILFGMKRAIRADLESLKRRLEPDRV